MDYDFNSRPRYLAKRRKRRPRTPYLLLILVIFAIGMFLINRPTLSTTEARTAPTAEDPVVQIQAPPPMPEVRREIIEGAIRPGDTITSLLGSYFTPRQIHDLNKQSRNTFRLSNICAGKPYKICVTDGAFERFEYDIDRNDQLIIQQSEEGFQIDRIPIEYTVETDLVQGTITSSLFETVSEIGENAELAIALSDIFAWDVDFILDIRKGDSFSALVEKRYRDGESAGYGRILAAEFSNRGDKYKAFLFKDGDQRPSYYDEKGKSVRKAFLKAPLAFSRISSGFTMKRFHPISKTWKAHPAIDYAAPTGTPIKSVGDGTIIRIGYTKYNGNHIKIRHNSNYETLSLHMSKFAKGMKRGRKISQGQVIGYVGSTGLATGPHLCFRMYKNGTPVNPYKVKAPATRPISSKRMAEFKSNIAPLMARLAGQKPAAVQHAKNQESPASVITQ